MGALNFCNFLTVSALFFVFMNVFSYGPLVYSSALLLVFISYDDYVASLTVSGTLSIALEVI